MDCAEELLSQNLKMDAIITASGSGTTHAGLLAGLRIKGEKVPVYGICVRRDKESQRARIKKKTQIVIDMLPGDHQIRDEDIHLFDDCLAPGYGHLNEFVTEAIKLAAEEEGLLVDPVYTGKALAGMMKLIREGKFSAQEKILFMHTGGTPALFGYPSLVS